MDATFAYSRGGGVPARRAMIRWSVRMFRRDWRQQTLTTALLALGVAGAVFGITAGNLLPLPVDYRLGAARQSVTVPISDAATLNRAFTVASETLGSVEPVEHLQAPLPGTVTGVDYRAQDPHGALGHSTLALRQGRYPQGPAEAAITRGPAAELHIGVGGSIGATPRHLRLALLVDGALVGTAGAGVVAGVLGWAGVSASLEGTAGHRMDRWGIPWGLVVVVALVAVVMATASAWWPARAISRMPVVTALSERPPRPAAAHRPMLLGLALLAAGAPCLALADAKHPPLIIVGTACTGLGVAFASPPVIRIAAALGGDGGRALNGRPLYVATPELLRLLGVPAATVPPTADLLAVRRGGLIDPLSRTTSASLRQIRGSRYTSVPAALMTDDGLARRHWSRVPVGWLLQSGHPLSRAEIGSVREIAAQAGLSAETRDEQGTLGGIQTGATAAGLLLALAVLATTVRLIRTEATPDLRTLTATGATSAVRRALTAATAGLLALAGALLGTAGSCLGLAAAYRSHLHALTRLPPADMAIIVLGVPPAAVVAGWLLAEREPATITRRLGD